MEEGFDMIDGESHPVVSVENFSVARDVIKSLRSSSNSNRCYKQNATRDNFLIENLEEFNKVVNVQVVTSSTAQLQEDRMNRAIAEYKPPIRYIVPKNKNTNNGKIMYNHTPTTSNRPDMDDYSSDDEPQKSPGKLVRSPKYDEGDDFDLKADSSDEEDWGGKKKPKQVSPPQHKTSVKAKKVDDDLDFGEDDEEDNAELLAYFTAPVSSTNTSSKNGRKSSTSSEVLMSTSAKLSTSTAKSKGSAGIRGIQELLREPNAFSGTSRGPSPGGGLLNSIKPGQAIRVKAPGKRRNTSGDF